MRSLTLCLLVACSSSSASPPAPVATFDEALARIAPAQCANAVRCGVIAASEQPACELGPPPKGTSHLVWSEAQLAHQRASIAAGRLTFDPSALADCIAAYTTGSCEPEISQSPGQRCIFVRAHVAAGGACSSWDECIDGHCSAQTGCMGHCVAHKQRGEVCSRSGNDGLCDDADYCDYGAHPQVGGAGVCKPRKPAGAECIEWNSCRTDLQCIGYHVTRLEPGAPEEIHPGKCAARGGTGAPCRPNESDCAPTFACALETKTCAPRSTSTCTAPRTCGDGLACDDLEAGWDKRGVWHATHAGTCKPLLAIGAACDPNALDTRCPMTTRCDVTSRTCAPFGDLGDRCQPTVGCFGDLYCDGKTTTCSRKIQLGGACPVQPKDFEAIDPCESGVCDPRRHVCVAGKC